MKILFVVRHSGFLRNFESVLRLLAERGHRVHLAFEPREKLHDPALLQTLTRECPCITYGWMPRYDLTLRNVLEYPWYALARYTRAGLDYLQYLLPAFEPAAKARARAEQQAPALVVRAARGAAAGSPRALGLLRSLIANVERTIPHSSAVERFLREQSPDLVLLTPLLWFGSRQVDFVRAARKVGVTSTLAVASWDHLTSKGAIHESPDWVIVWNDWQKKEAVELHDVPENRVVATGAQIFDHWFTWSPSTSRAEFCQAAGLNPEREIILYLCSSPFIAPKERVFVERWIHAVRSSADARLQQAGLLIRPHPQHGEQWADADYSDLPHVVVWPRAGSNPTTRSSKASYFDSMHHAQAVVGINTSGCIEAAILGKPVYTVLDPDFADTQEGTLHFEHLASPGRGLLHTARELGEHAAQLAEALAPESTAAERSRQFVKAFVRPRGLDQAATPLFVDTLEQMGRQRPSPSGATVKTTFLRVALYPLALACTISDEVTRPRKPLRLKRKLRKALRTSYRKARSILGAAVRAIFGPIVRPVAHFLDTWPPIQPFLTRYVRRKTRIAWSRVLTWSWIAGRARRLLSPP